MDSAQGAASTPLVLRLLGPVEVLRQGRPQALPASRKVRALMAYLALAPAPVLRERLCELLWPMPDDPRAELRGSLSKLRPLLDSAGHPRLLAEGDAVRLDLEGVSVDAREVERAVQGGLQGVPTARLRELIAFLRGDFLQGLEIDNCPQFSAWQVAQRRRFRASHLALLEALVERLPPEDDETLSVLAGWLQISPFDRHAHMRTLAALARRGALRDGEEHLAIAVRTFEAEGLDPGLLVDAWRRAREDAASPPSVAAVQAGPTAAAQSMAAAPPAAPSSASAPAEHGAPGLPPRASIAVMPFDASGADAPGQGGLADALVHDVIVGLARLRALFVIAQGTVFALGGRGMGPEEAGRLLHVDYVANGRLRRTPGRLSVWVELVEVRSARVVWSEDFDEPLDDAFMVLDTIGQRIVSAIDGEVELAERQRALLKPPGSLDAWESYHRGLWHMYRFRQDDNECARRLFERALKMDPTFARAHAALSFTHFQDAFQNWSDRARAVRQALDSAGRSIITDERDPAAHWAMGRALWLHGDAAPSLDELESAVRLSPNFAMGHYSLAFVHSQSGDPGKALRASDQSRHLSPFDPMMFAMMGARALALVRLGRYEEAAEWSLKAAARPNAHVHILGIAAHCLALAGRLAEARGFVQAIRRQQPGYGRESFFAAFRFDDDAAAAFGQAAKTLDW
ncbi:transcriptional regulator [Variovorax sp. OV329]|uniref:transcriptional regulator n=1 Tax=Variovorax sp. OV329 TaxID=1882825 RepID=UPI000B824522|nr:transcriptional regulator [Variovorax sp. OV329]